MPLTRRARRASWSSWSPVAVSTRPVPHPRQRAGDPRLDRLRRHHRDRRDADHDRGLGGVAGHLADGDRRRRWSSWPRRTSGWPRRCCSALLVRRRPSPPCRAPSIGYWDANPIVLTIAAGFAIGGTATWLSGGTPVYADGDGYDVLNSTPLGLPGRRVRAARRRGPRRVGAAPDHRRPADVPGRREPGRGPRRRAPGRAGDRRSPGRSSGCASRSPGSSSRRSTRSATVTLGGTLTLDAIAAVLVGGTAIAGGRGSALRTLGGAVLISVIADLLLIRGYSTGAQILVKGLLVLVVVVLVHLRSTRGRR